ncbi:MAG: hypothetical protein J6P07_08125 [Spirochaetaceae bacterium]|nr:hypothetical protein [Spirochaetaceae bacterium]MBO7731855.1 hypothetical protein [Methanobrevibacter sp.]
MDTRKESFVFHAEYLDDLPEEHRATYALYVFDYAIYGKIPELTGFEKTVWAKIQRRIDYDIASWEETKKSRSEAGRNGGIKSGITRRSKRSTALENEANEAQLQTAKQNEAMPQNVQKNEANEAVSVNVSESVNEYVSEYESVSANVNLPTGYAKQVFNLYKELGLPCCNGNEFLWETTEFGKAYDTLQRCYKGLHSNDVMSAIRNYSYVLNNANVYDGFKKRIRSFSGFVNWERFTDFLPCNFDINNFTNWSDQKPENKSVGLDRALEILNEENNK